MIRVNEKERVKIDSFENINTFLSFAENAPLNDAFKNMLYLASDKEGTKAKRFSGTTTFSEAQELMSKGYKKGMMDLLNTTTNINIKAKNEAPKRDPYFYGSSLCLSNFLTGMPKTMYRRHTTEQKQRVITINYDNALSYDTDKKVLLEAGKNLMSLVTYFENKGIKVQLNIISVSCNYEKEIKALSIKIKDYKQKLNPMLISYPLTHPSFFRRHVFKWIEKSPITSESFYTEGYGIPAYRYLGNEAKERMRKADFLGKEGYYITAYEAAGCNTIEELLKALGIK